MKPFLKTNNVAGLPTDEELLREASAKIRRKEYGQLTMIAEKTMSRYAITIE